MSLLEERDVARWGREARDWLTHDERARTIGLVVLSVTISIAISLMATAIVGFASRRRTATAVPAQRLGVGEPLAEVATAPEAAAGQPVPGAAVSTTEEEAAETVGA